MSDYPQLSDLILTHPQVEDAIEAARAWQERKRNGETGISLILSGPNGTGKSTIAKAIQWAFRYKIDDLNYVVPLGRFFKASNLIVELGARVDDYSTVVPPAIDAMVGNAPVIVIDDLGAQVSMPYIKGDMQPEEIRIRLFLLIDHCMNRLVTHMVDDQMMTLPDPASIVITTNLDIGDGSNNSQFAKYVGPRVYDRLMEICPRGMMVNMRDVPSFRKRKGGR